MHFVDYPTLLDRVGLRKVVVFGGYSGRGYADPAALATLLRIMVREAGNGSFYVGGATKAGIGDAYSLIPAFAAEFGFRDIETAGIVSRNARSPELAGQGLVVYVDTAPGDWAVRVEGRSLMVDIAARKGGVMVYFGGGATARDELIEAAGRGVEAVLVDDPGVLPGSTKDASCAAGGRSAMDEALRAEALDAPVLKGIRIWHRGMDCPMFPA
jgi:hypothetical protein